MKAFTFVRPRTVDAAVAALAETGGAVHAGGVDLLDRMKEHVDEPSHLVTLLDVPGRDAIALEDDGGVHLGAGVTLAALAENDVVRRFLPSLAEAAGQAASPAIRHRATLGGNLAQRTRCGYFRIASFSCLKRGADACPVRAETGVQETAAVFANEPCASAHPPAWPPSSSRSARSWACKGRRAHGVSRWPRPGVRRRRAWRATWRLPPTS